MKKFISSFPRIFYTAITQHLGFPNYGDEYKLMGLSSYGMIPKRKLYKLLPTQVINSN